VIKRLLFIFFIGLSTLASAQAPTATITAASSSLCTGQGESFTCNTTNTPTVFGWAVSPSYGVVYFSSTDSPTLNVIFNKSGVFTVSLTVSNASGTTTAVRSMTVNQKPTANFSASLTANGFPADIVLTNFSSNATGYQWSYNETGSTDNTTDAVHSYSTSGAYTVTLVALNNNGCTDTLTYDFYISDSSGITLPNVFTPNYDDINDVFKPIARGISSMKVNIYTRWGNFVYGWETVNGSWDGHTTSGEACLSGTYFCVLEATGFDGQTYKLKTNITLIRNP
jgi:gliding motility-associated-like protein